VKAANRYKKAIEFNHPNVLKTLDVGAFNKNDLYIIMPLMETTLEDRYKELKKMGIHMDLKERCKLYRQTLEGLEYFTS